MPDSRGRRAPERTKIRPGLSVCLIVQDEEHRLRRCLESVQFADEIVVVDGGSQDGTSALARKLGARVVRRKFTGFIDQKNFALRQARHEWVLTIDADEVVTPELADSIRQVLGSAGAAEGGSASSIPAAYRTARMTFYLGRWIKHCGWYPEYKTRLARNGWAHYEGTEGSAIHENLTLNDRAANRSVGTLAGHLEHYSYANISDHLKRIDRYSSLIAGQKFRRGRRSGPVWAVLKGMSKFVITYVYHRGFLDGRAGFVISVLAAYYNFLKYVKLWELARSSEAAQ